MTAHTMAQTNPLRPITQRLNTTPVEDLPRIAGFLASSLKGCSSILRHADNQTGDSAVIVHKLRTRISSLVQDRTPEGRFTAAVLIKTIVEIGGQAVLGFCEPWARSLITCLNKSDSAEVKEIYLATILRIFILSKEYASAEREIAGSLLPPFNTATLALVKPATTVKLGKSITVTSPLLSAVLRCWLELSLRYPATMRPFVARIKPICLSVIGQNEAPSSAVHLAIGVLSSLPRCAPKNGAPTEYAQLFADTIAAAHSAVDQVFRAVNENSVISASTGQRPFVKKDFSIPPHTDGVDTVGLVCWSGIYDGTTRVVSLLTLLQEILYCPLSHQVTIPLAEIVDLTGRLLAIAAPIVGQTNNFAPKLNSEVSKEERDELWANLTRLHVSSIGLLRSLAEVFGQAVSTLLHVIYSQVLSVFESEHRDTDIRVQVYGACEKLLQEVGCAGIEQDGSQLSLLIKQCCADLTLHGDTKSARSTTKNPTKNGRQQNPNPISMETPSRPGVRDSTSNIDTQQSEEFSAAWRLLPWLLKRIPTVAISHSLRTELDSTSILAGHRDAMLASIINPAGSAKGQKASTSILPFLTRHGNGRMDVEALLRPRMPVAGAAHSAESQLQEDRRDETDSDGDATPDEDAAAPTDDLLSRLGDSVNNQVEINLENKSFEQGAPVQPGQLPELQTFGGSAVSRKRDNVQMENNLNATGAPGAPNGLATTKKPKLDDVVGLTIISTEQATVPRISEDSGSAQTAQAPLSADAFTPRSESNFISGVAPRLKPVQDDSDSDDSAIPTIDPSMTDDEDEMGEE